MSIMDKTNLHKYGSIDTWQIDRSAYRNFITTSDASDWGHKYYNEWAKKYAQFGSALHKNEVLSQDAYCCPVEHYCGYTYDKINDYLRFQSDQKNLQIDGNINYCELADLLALVICSAPSIPENIITYRLVCDEFIRTLIAKNKMTIPTPALESGFMSTGLLESAICNSDQPFSVHKNMLKIYVPKFSKGVYVNAIRGCSRNEYELLINKNSYLALIEYPYVNQYRKNVYECLLLQYNLGFA